MLRKTCLYCSIVLAFLLFNPCLHAQTNFLKVDEWLEQNTPQMGGRATLLIFKDGKIVYAHSENEQSRKQKIAAKIIAKKRGSDMKDIAKDISPNTKIAIASCSKWLSAALVMTFIDDGTLLLTDTLGKYLPQIAASGKGKITIAQCLSHTTGINSGDLKESMQSFNKAATMEESINIIAGLPLESAPGESFRYSNTGLQLAAAVVEKVGGNNFSTLFKNRIATKCDMPSTDFGTKPVPLAAGGAFSTANDYLHFLQMLLNEGVYNGKQVLSKQSITAMQQNQKGNVKTVYSPGEAGNWGYGFGEWTIGEVAANARATSVSSPGLFGSFPWIDTEKKYAAVLFTYNLNNKGRHERYVSLKAVVDAALAN